MVLATARAGLCATAEASDAIFESLAPGNDASLLALASELEAAARPYLAYDRDAEVTSADPDCEEARETGRQLFQAVKAVADRIFVHRAESLAGLLVQAHAATLVAKADWTDTSSFVDQDGKLLRIVANGLFRLAGVDWRGRPIGAEPIALAVDAPTGTSDDTALLALAPALLPMLDRYDELWGLVEARYANVEAEAEVGGSSLASVPTEDLPSWGAYIAARAPFDAMDDALEAMVAPHMDRPVSTLDALLLKQRIGRSLRQYQGGAVHDLGALVSVRLGSGEMLLDGSHSHRAPASPDAALIPLAEAAIAEERAATAISKATDHDPPPGNSARSMQLLELVTATDARTAAGVAAKARLLLTHARQEDDLDGDWRCQALALSLARDAARLGAAG